MRTSKLQKNRKKARVSMSWQDTECERILEAQTLLGLNDFPSAVRFLVQRGLDATATQMASRRLLARLEAECTPQQMLPIFEAVTKRAEEERRGV